MRWSLLALSLLALNACSEPAAPGFNRRWQKLDPIGQPIAPLDGPWACVLDRQTGLTWEVKNENETLHHNLATYSWFDSGLGSRKAGSCADDQRYYDCDTADLVAGMNAEKRCGYRDWRLPTAEEFKTLLDPNAYPGDTRVDSSLFPYLQRGMYWTATHKTDATGQTVVLSHHLGDNSEAWLPTKLAVRAMLVRDSKGNPEVSSEFPEGRKPDPQR